MVIVIIISTLIHGGFLLELPLFWVLLSGRLFFDRGFVFIFVFPAGLVREPFVAVVLLLHGVDLFFDYAEVEIEFFREVVDEMFLGEENLVERTSILRD
jgi:hypothetical protein